VAAALVAAGVAAVGYLVLRGLLNVSVLGVGDDERLFQPSMGGYAVTAAIAALIATGVMHLLLMVAPRPHVFFGWIVFLATTLAALFPIVEAGWTSAALATAGVNIVIGVCIGSLVSMSAGAAVASERRAPGAGAIR
jgi:hypothetical protein